MVFPMNERFMIGHLPPARTAPIHGTRNMMRPGAIEQGRSTFQALLEQQQSLKFSQHAQLRLKQRGIQLDDGQLNRIAGAVEQAAAKGAKDSLVLFRDIAMIVSVPNRTVVTAMDGAAMKDHIFTQIDSAVVLS